MQQLLQRSQQHPLLQARMRHRMPVQQNGQTMQLMTWTGGRDRIICPQPSR